MALASVAPACGVLVVALVGCSKVDVGLDEPKSQPFAVRLQVTSDPGAPLGGAEVLSGTKVVGKTDDAGSTEIRIRGTEGEQIELTVKCPPRYESPSAPLSVPLRRLGASSPAPRFDVRCAPSERTVVVGVRADNGPNVPVEYLGRTVARTDASGAALFTVHVRPSEQVALTLDTSEKGAEQLRPQSPTLTFVAKDEDDFVLLDQAFTVERKPQARSEHRPTRL